jgi:hypothetical protein
MSVYTVHEPPPQAANALSVAERFVFVRDGFSLWAFLFAPLWMLRYGMWLVLLGYAVVAAGLEIAMASIGASRGFLALVGFLISVLVGLEASTLRRFALSLRGYKNIGVVSGSHREDAERRFFDTWLAPTTVQAGATSETSTAAPGASVPPPIPRVPRGPDVIGLFPEPGAKR